MQHDMLRNQQDPNDIETIQALQRRLAQTGPVPTSMRQLLEHYLSPGIRPEKKSLVASLFLQALRGDLAQFQPAVIGLDTEHPAFKMIYRGFLHHLDMAFSEIELLSRMQQGEPDQSLAPKFIVAIPKSGSSLLGICLGNMIKLTRGGQLEGNPFMNRGYPTWWKVGETFDWDLRPEIGADGLFRQFPGGIYKGHITPSPKNLAILRLYDRSKYLVVVRDPRDQIVAAYCQMLRFSNQSPTDNPPTREQTQRDVVEFMRGGALIENIEFVGKWLTERHQDQSMVVTYEDLIQRPLEVLEQTASHFDLALSRPDIERTYAYAESITNRTNGKDTSGNDASIYPLGWTGKIGIWKEYFSDEATDLFDQLMRCLDECTPWGQAIRDFYPSMSHQIAAA